MMDDGFVNGTPAPADSASWQQGTQTTGGWRGHLANFFSQNKSGSGQAPKAQAMGQIGPGQFRQAGLVTDTQPADLSMLNAAIGAK